MMKHLGVILVAVLFGLIGTRESNAFPLTLEQRKRFQEFLPRTFPKLEARDPVHVVLLGDSVSGGYTPLPSAWETNNPLYSFTGMFLSRLAEEFFYPGGVRLLNPPPGGSEKAIPYLGDEITLEALTGLDATALTGLRHATTDAFLHEPDLVLIQYGIYDAFGRISIDTYRQAIDDIIQEARKHRTDVIVMAPTLVRYGAGEVGWGLERPYASAAREVANGRGVLFLDCGRHLARFGGGTNADTEADAVMEVVGERMGRVFHFGPELEETERVHPAVRANRFLGDSLFNELKNGEKSSPFSYAGVARFDPSGTVNLVIAIRNQTGKPQVGTIGALAVGHGLLPIQHAKRFSVGPRGTAQLVFRYRRPVVGKARDGSDILFPLEPSDEFSRFSFLVEDSIRSELVDLPLRIGPISPVWKSRQFLNVENRIRVEWDLVNGTDKPVSGTFQVGYGSKVGQPTSFSASPLGTKTVFSVFDFVPPDGVEQFQRDIWIQVDVDGVVNRFSREMEATRDLAIGETRRMRRWSEYANADPAVGSEDGPTSRGDGRGVGATFDANEDALYVVVDMNGVEIPDLGERAALEAKLYLDARPSDDVLSFGAIEPIRIYVKGEDGPGTTSPIPPGAFGAEYATILDPKGVTSVLQTEASGERSLIVRVPRSYMHRHDWTLGSLDSRIGVRLEITTADSDGDASEPFPPSNRWVTHSPTFAYEGRAIRGFSANDARSLMTLRLSRQPVASWSTRIY